MTIKLYPANDEPGGTDEILDLLRQAGCLCQLMPLDQTMQAILIEGDRKEVCRQVRGWLDQHPGRTANPATLCDSSIHKGEAVTTIEMHHPSVGFA